MGPRDRNRVETEGKQWNNVKKSIVQRGGVNETILVRVGGNVTTKREPNQEYCRSSSGSRRDASVARLWGEKESLEGGEGAPKGKEGGNKQTPRGVSSVPEFGKKKGRVLFQCEPLKGRKKPGGPSRNKSLHNQGRTSRKKRFEKKLKQEKNGIVVGKELNLKRRKKASTFKRRG